MSLVAVFVGQWEILYLQGWCVRTHQFLMLFAVREVQVARPTYDFFQFCKMWLMFLHLSQWSSPLQFSRLSVTRHNNIEWIFRHRHSKALKLFQRITLSGSGVPLVNVVSSSRNNWKFSLEQFWRERICYFGSSVFTFFCWPWEWSLSRRHLDVVIESSWIVSFISRIHSLFCTEPICARRF